MKKEIKKELEEIAPFLSKIEKKEAYDVPFQYFENLADKIMERVEPKEPMSVSWIDRVLKSIFKPKMAIVFTTLLLLFTGIWFLTSPKTKSSSYESLASEVTPEDITTYISEEIDEFPLESLEEMDIDFSVTFDEIESIDEALLDEIIDEFEDEEIEQI